MKKMLVLLLVLLMSVSAAAEGIPGANAIVDYAAMAQHYAAYSVDAQSGIFSARTNEAEALLDWFWVDGSRSKEAVVFYLEVAGNRDTGVLTPAIKVMYIGPKTINATAVSFLAEGTRYDFAAFTQKVTFDGKTAEMTTVPLTKEGLAVLNALENAPVARIRLIGDDVDTTVLDAESTGTYSRMAYAGVKGIPAMRRLLADAGMNEYDLWDYSAAAWAQQGVDCKYVTAAVNQLVAETEVSDQYGMILPGTSGTAARRAQQLLIDAGFMAGSTQTQVNTRVVKAVLRAQRHFGLLETGCIDAQLTDRLASGAALETAQAPVMNGTPVGTTAEMELTRYWFADAVNVQRGIQVDRKPVNSDNVLLIADGTVLNTASSTIRLGIELRASVVYNGERRYDALLVCACNEETTLDTFLIPGATARMLLYAEVPAPLAADNGAEWTVEVSSGSETVTFTLE